MPNRKTLLKITIVGFTLTSGTLYAHGSHEHASHGHIPTQDELSTEHIQKVSEEHIQRVANKQMLNLIEKAKIAKSWSDAPVSNMEKKPFHRTTEWVVIYKNQEIKDQTKQTLYIFVNLYGKVTGANHTGK
ncbi:MAG: hypothetical protein J7J02_07210 [Sulfurovum sp.]|nr:hypothetical protein [Sulfurovum sp.]